MSKNNLRVIALGSVTALALAAGSTASAATFSAGNTNVTLYGYAKLEMFYDVNENLGQFASNALVEDDPAVEGHFKMQATQSRLGFRTATPTDQGDLVTVIEGDFGGNTLGLRHAYGSWNGILAGQTWTNFTSFTAYTPSVDFIGSGGHAVLGRHAQLRYTAGPVSVSIEKPGGDGGAGAGGRAADIAGGANKASVPDFTVRFTDRAGPVAYSVSALARFLEVDDGDDSDSTVGFGVNASMGFTLAPGMTLRAAVTHGDGIGGYMYQGPAGTGFMDGDSIETISQTGVNLGFSMAAGPGSVNVSYGHVFADVDDGAVSDYGRGFINYMWSPVQNVTYGAEVLYLRNDIEGGDSSDAIRLIGMASYSF